MAGKKKTAVIIGAGPAGLTAARELLEKTDIRPVILEAEEAVGGIARTICHNGNRMDIGGHRFFSKSPEVVSWWYNMMPLQEQSSDTSDEVFLKRPRKSRIFFLRKFFDYPVTLSGRTFANMGFARTVKAVGGYLLALLHPRRPEKSLEDFYINRFGKPLYRMFFEHYTEKVWGIHPSALGADWGSQRVKGLSVWAVFKDMLAKKTGRKKGGKVETSLIEEFIYPKYGPGQFWEVVADKIKAGGGEILLNSRVIGLDVDDCNVTSLEYRSKDGSINTIDCDYVLSTMPIKDLMAAIHDAGKPDDVSRIAAGLPYRDFITVGLCVKKLKLSGGRVSDTWIYIQERDVRIGRLQIFNNWSPYLVGDNENTVWMGLEYFCSEEDELWEMSGEDFIKMAVDELAGIDIISKEDVLDSCHVRVRKAYPAYYGSYYELDKVKEYLNGLGNLFCLGRNGQHRYNNMDHSMLTAIRAVEAIAGGKTDKSAIWAVNSEEEYHEG